MNLLPLALKTPHPDLISDFPVVVYFSETFNVIGARGGGGLRDPGKGSLIPSPLYAL